MLTNGNGFESRSSQILGVDFIEPPRRQNVGGFLSTRLLASKARTQEALESTVQIRGHEACLLSAESVGSL